MRLQSQLWRLQRRRATRAHTRRQCDPWRALRRRALRGRGRACRHAPPTRQALAVLVAAILVAGVGADAGGAFVAASSGSRALVVRCRSAPPRPSTPMPRHWRLVRRSQCSVAVSHRGRAAPRAKHPGRGARAIQPPQARPLYAAYRLPGRAQPRHGGVVNGRRGAPRPRLAVALTPALALARTVAVAPALAVAHTIALTPALVLDPRPSCSIGTRPASLCRQPCCSSARAKSPSRRRAYYATRARSAAQVGPSAAQSMREQRAHPPPPTLHLRPSTSNPPPPTLHLQPSTSNPAPPTLQPSTSNPRLNPAPESPHPRRRPSPRHLIHTQVRGHAT